MHWHMVGQIQRKKSRALARWAHTAHSVDSPPLAAAHDRAVQLFAYYASGSPDQADSVTLRYHAYLAANPSGPIAPEAPLPRLS